MDKVLIQRIERGMKTVAGTPDLGKAPNMLQPLATFDSRVDWEQGQTDIFEPLHTSV